jgi:hypothetical protein
MVEGILLIVLQSVVPFLIGSIGVWLYYRQQLINVQTELEDKKVIINELIEHANRVQQTQESVTKVKPLKKEKSLTVEKTKKTKK